MKSNNQIQNNIRKCRNIAKSTWYKIFNLKDENSFIRYPNNYKTIQGVTWILLKKDIVMMKTLTVTNEMVKVFYEET